MKKRDLFLATFSDKAADVIKKYGIGIEFNHFCISTTLNDERIDRTIAAMEKEARNCGCEDPAKRFVHGPFTEIIPMAIDPMFVETALKRYNQTYEGCRRLGVNRMVVHTGWIPEMYFPVWHVKKSTEFWKRYFLFVHFPSLYSSSRYSFSYSMTMMRPYLVAKVVILSEIHKFSEYFLALQSRMVPVREALTADRRVMRCR